MSASGEMPVPPENTKPNGTRRFQTNVRTLIALVACCAAGLWAYRRVQDEGDPVLSEARVIQKRAFNGLKSSKPAERVGAIQDLERLGAGDSSVAIPSLLRALEDPDALVRRTAAYALITMVPPLSKTGVDSPLIGNALTALIQGLSDQDVEVRKASIFALGSILSSMLVSPSVEADTGAATTALMRLIKDPQPDIRVASAGALSKIAAPRPGLATKLPIDRNAVIKALVELLSDREPKVRIAAINAMSSQAWCARGQNPASALAKPLNDEMPEVRAAAVKATIRFKSGLDPWISPLLKLLETDPDPTVRRECLNTLEYAFTPPAITAQAVPLLIAALRSKSSNVRARTAWLLRELKTEATAAIPELLRVANEPVAPGVGQYFGPGMAFDPGCAAASALGRIAPETDQANTAIAALIEVTRSGPEIRRGWAAMALADFGTRAAGAEPALIQLVSDTADGHNNENAMSAVIALGKVAVNSATPDKVVAALQVALKSRDTFSRRKALEALRAFGAKAIAAVPAIRALEDDRDTRLTAEVESTLRAIEGANPDPRAPK
jgi:HEAT repeat protein